MQDRPEESIVLCRRVVALKPDHFGAWNGMALCAIQIEDWPLALEAVQRVAAAPAEFPRQPATAQAGAVALPRGMTPGEPAGGSIRRNPPLRVADLSGEWIGRYPGHFDEVVRISQDGLQVGGGQDHRRRARARRARSPGGPIYDTLQGKGTWPSASSTIPASCPGAWKSWSRDLIVFHWEERRRGRVPAR